MNYCSRKNFDGVFASTGCVTGVWAEFIIFLLTKDPAIRIWSIFMNVESFLILVKHLL
jgi:hypothetical protein